jgi:hypothetical protein
VSDVARCFEHVLEIRRPVFVRRRSNRDELDVAVFHALFDVGGKADPAGFPRALQDFVKARLMDRHAAVVEDVDLASIDIDAKYVVADFGETRTGHQSDVARANNGYFHTLSGEPGGCRIVGPEQP